MHLGFRDLNSTNGFSVFQQKAFRFKPFLQEFVILLTTPFCIPVLVAKYGHNIVYRKHLVPTRRTPYFFWLLFLIEAWMPWIANTIVLTLSLKDLFFELIVMDCVFLFRVTVTALRYGYMNPEVRRTIYHSRDPAAVELAHNNTQLITGWL